MHKKRINRYCTVKPRESFVLLHKKHITLISGFEIARQIEEDSIAASAAKPVKAAPHCMWLLLVRDERKKVQCLAKCIVHCLVVIGK